MSQDPSPYDLLQDNQISALQDIVTPYYPPPGDVEYSFPVVGQGITADQYRLMSLGQANGIIHGDNGVVNDSPDSTGYRYYLEGHATDAETNQRNTLILRAGTSAEAIVEGFYHRLTEDMELPFPAVSTPTTYHVCLTFDPRREEEPTGPIHVEVYAGEPPTTHGRVHLILHTVHREPNQLLSQATRTRYRPYTAGVVAVQHQNQLPNWRGYPAGTLAVPSGGEARGIYVRSNTTGDWLNTQVGEWVDLLSFGGWIHDGAVRRRNGGIDIRGHFSRSGEGNRSRLARLPEGFSLSTGYYQPIYTSRHGVTRALHIEPATGDLNILGGDIEGGWAHVSVFVPDYYLAN